MPLPSMHVCKGGWTTWKYNAPTWPIGWTLHKKINIVYVFTKLPKVLVLNINDYLESKTSIHKWEQFLFICMPFTGKAIHELGSSRVVNQLTAVKFTFQPTYCSSGCWQYVCEDAALHTVPLYHLQFNKCTLQNWHHITTICYSKNTSPL